MFNTDYWTFLGVFNKSGMMVTVFAHSETLDDSELPRNLDIPVAVSFVLDTIVDSQLKMLFSHVVDFFFNLG